MSSIKEKIYAKIDSNKKELRKALQGPNVEETYLLLDRLSKETNELLYGEEIKELVEIDFLGLPDLESTIASRELLAQYNDLERIKGKVYELKQSITGFSIRDSYTVD
jgi:hypothetical protein